MKRTNQQIITAKLINGEHLPKWATQDGVMAALEDIAADLECGLLRPSVLLKRQEDLRQAARQFRCLEAFEPVARQLEI